MLDRRQFLCVCAGLGAIVLPGRVSAESKPSAGRIAFRLKETAGLRRFSYPVHGVMPERTFATGLKYRLTRSGLEVPAQFREVGAESEHPSMIFDFNASPGPMETEEYTIEFGTEVNPGVEPSRGLVASHEAGKFRIANLPYLMYEIPDDLAGFIASIKSSELEFLTPKSQGLFLKVDGKSNGESRLRLAASGNKSTACWTRKGPVAVGLQFKGTLATSSGRPLETTVDLSFVNSKSWIETSWTVEDPDDRIDSLGVDLEMKLDGLPALVDCGASSTVYSHLRDAESLTFMGRPATQSDDRLPRWIVEQGGMHGRKPFATAVPGDRAPEGWIHLMDRTRCSALAVADFAVFATDRILVEPTGRIELERRFTKTIPPRTSSHHKSMRFWLHVVPMPVQVGAVTSPQAMLAPLVLEWID